MAASAALASLRVSGSRPWILPWDRSLQPFLSLRLRLGPFRRSRLPTVSLAQRGSMLQDGTAEPTLAPCS